MLDTKQFVSAIKQIADEKGIPEDKIIETIELAIAAAYKKDYGEKGQIVRAKMDPVTDEFSMTQIKYVVEGVDEEEYIIGEVPGIALQPDERPRQNFGSQNLGGQASDTEEEDLRVKFNPEKYITLEEAKKISKKYKVGDEVVTDLPPKTEFGRIAAQTAKQVIIQRLREIERNVIFEEYKNKEGEVVSGVVQRREGPTVYIDIGRTNAILPFNEQLPQDGYRISQRLKFSILKVEETPRGPVIILSRAHPGLVNKLFELEVPEIETGTVEIKGVAREAGSRTKIAVISTTSEIDPIGSLVGQKGVRVQTVINELSGEKIDIIKWDEEPEKLIANALSPAKILDVKILDAKWKHALAEVADDQFSLAIGKRGQNVRLAAKLTGWKIDVRSPIATITAEEAEKEVEASGLSEAKIPTDSVGIEEPAVEEILEAPAEVTPEVATESAPREEVTEENFAEVVEEAKSE